MGKTIENYNLIEQIGQGTFAKVFKAKHLITQKQYAVKVISSQKLKDIPKLQQGAVNQINILSKLRNQCDYIIGYVDMLKTTNNFYFVYEYCNGGTLDKMIQKEGFFSEQKAIKYLRQILQAFKILNKYNIMHRDLKPENILLHNGNLKIADFSFCKLLENKDDLTQTMLGSPIYMAPEVLKGEIYTMKADVWSMGIVFYQMLFGKCPFETKSIALLIKLLEKQDLYIPNQPKISQISEQFLRKVLVKDYNQRIGWDDIFTIYHITEQGQIIHKKQMSAQKEQFQLRSSIKGNNKYSLRVTIPNGTTNGQGVNFNNSSGQPKYGYSQSPLSANPAIGFNRSMEYNKQMMQNQIVSQKSPLKTNQLRSTTDFRNSLNINLNTTTSMPNSTNKSSFSVLPHRMSSYELTNFSNQQSITQNNTNILQLQKLPFFHQNSSQNNFASKQDKGEQNFKPALTRIQILTKNHNKSILINQMVLDIFLLQQQYSNYICYFLFKNACKQIQILYENLKKQSNDQIYKDFKLLIQNQLQCIINVNKNFYQAIIQQQKQLKLLGQDNNLKINNKNLQQQLFQHKQKIIKLYIQHLNDTDQDIRLASQVVDYLQENILIKRDAYQRMSREHLFKQIKNKTVKE